MLLSYAINIIGYIRFSKPDTGRLPLRQVPSNRRGVHTVYSKRLRFFVSSNQRRQPDSWPEYHAPSGVAVDLQPFFYSDVLGLF